MLSFLSTGCAVRDACQAQANYLSRLVTWSTITVATGVALEAVELFHDLLAWMKRRRARKKELSNLRELAEFLPVDVQCRLFASRSSPDHPGWVSVLGRLGLILVVVGVVGEWKYGAKLEDTHNDIHTLDIAELTAAQRKAGDAEISAEGAADAAGRAQKSADAAGEALTRVQEKALALAKQAEEIDADFGRMQWIISARRVRDVDGLTTDLKNGFKGQRVVLRSYIGSQEAFWLCRQLVEIAKNAEMNPQDECATQQITRVPVTDLLISAPSHEEAEKFAWPLKKPGRVAGYLVEMNEGPVLTVLVGVKPSFPVWPRKGARSAPEQNK